MSAIRTAEDRLLFDMNEQKVPWTKYFEEIYTFNPPSDELPAAGLQMADVDPTIDESPSSLDDIREVVSKLNGGNATVIYSISAELLKARGEGNGLNVVLTAVWRSGTIPPDPEREMVVPI